VATPPPAEKAEDRAEPAALTATTAEIKALALHLGAAEVGITRLDPAFVYSHVGRGPEPWGSPIHNGHRFAVVFSLPMDYAHVEAAPRLAITEESAREYLQGALISITLAAHIRGLSWPARAHIAGSNYQIMLPPVAVDAGLGELGRFGYLISQRLGARVRLGAVTTDLPLVPDVPVRFGVQEFCEICRRCADNCPSASIPGGPRRVVRGIAKWPLDVESCLSYWRWLGTDCGICMRVCPFSHPRALVHDLVRAGIARSAFARRIALLGEDLLYGRQLTRESASRPA
jgi:reductive dehalogenase